MVCYIWDTTCWMLWLKPIYIEHKIFGQALSIVDSALGLGWFINM